MIYEEISALPFGFFGTAEILYILDQADDLSRNLQEHQSKL